MRGRGGQVVIFLVMALVALVFLFLWNADLHRIVTMKTRSQNAGDAAALAVARWQASALNLIGELNLMHALALADGDASAADAITNIQARLCLVGPMAGLLAAQQVAKQNGIHAHPEFEERFRRYRDDVASDTTVFPAFYEGARDDYVAMLDAILFDRIAVKPPYPSVSSEEHMLLDPEFYWAIETRDWCWFERNAPGLLESYTDHTYWPELPEPPAIRELYPLRVRPVNTSLAVIVNLDTLRDQADAAGTDLGRVNAANVVENRIWYCYEEAWWGPWDRLNTDDPVYPFPVLGPPKEEYDYAGADAVAGVRVTVQRQTPGLDDGGSRQDSIGWVAAAKPFGYLTEDDNARKPPADYGLVIPAFRDVRLIPLDASSGDGNYDFEMEEHFTLYLDRGGHLQVYVDTGQYQPDCRFCENLERWDTESFRQEGLDWLSENDCVDPPGPGPGPGGGDGGGGGWPPPRIGH